MAILANLAAKFFGITLILCRLPHPAAESLASAPTPASSTDLRPPPRWGNVPKRPPGRVRRSKKQLQLRIRGSSPEEKTEPAKKMLHNNSDPTVWPGPSDIYIVSYPKSGQTWLRFLLSNLAWGNPQNLSSAMNFQSVEDLIPFLEDGNQEWIKWTFRTRKETPRLWKSHMPYNTQAYPCTPLNMAAVQCECPNCASKFQRVIYLLRDGWPTM